MLTPAFTIKRGEVYYVNESPHNPSVGHEIWSNRAAVVVSNDVFNARSGVVVIVYLNGSRQERNTPTHVSVKCRSKRVIAFCEQIHTVDISRLGDKMDTLTEAEMTTIDAALLFALQINNTVNPSGIFKKWEKYIHTLNLPVNGNIPNYDPMREVEKLRNYIQLLEKDVASYKTLYETAQEKLFALKDWVPPKDNKG